MMRFIKPVACLAVVMLTGSQLEASVPARVTSDIQLDGLLKEAA